MLRQIVKRGFAARLNPKFPTDTVAGIYKVAVASNFMFDAVRFDQQRFNWTLKEFDRYSSAFAYGLVENGYAPGDKLVLWLDQTNSAEILVAQMGAAKAGVAVVSFSEKDSQDALDQTLRDSGARGLFFSPSTQAGERTRGDIVSALLPSIASSYPGDALNVPSYPNLKSIVQSGHANIRGVIKFKDALVYANPQFNCFTLPQNSVDSTLFECYRGGKHVSTFSSGDIVEKSFSLWENHFSATSGDVDDGKLFNYEVRSGEAARPIFMSLDLETPLGFASFLANASNQRKVFVPSSLNASNILKSIRAQQSPLLVCDQDFFEIELPGPLAAEYKENCSNVISTIVAGESQKVNSSVFDSSKATVIDPLTF